MHMKKICTFRWISATGRVWVSEDAWQLFDLAPMAHPTLEGLLQRACVYDRADILRVLSNAAQDRSAFDVEWRFLMADESIRVIRVTAHPVTTENGEIEHLGALQEVTGPTSLPGLPATEMQKIGMEAKQFHITVDNAPGPIWSTLPSGHVDFVNRRWLEYTGTTFEDSCGLGWQASIHPEDLPGVLNERRQWLASGQAAEMKARLRRHDGVYRWFLFRSTPYYDADQKLLKWYGQTVDIEDLIRAEDLLAAERTVLEMLSTSASLGATLDATCRMVDGMLPGCTSSVWLLGDDDSTVTDFVAPGLPRGFIEDLNKLIDTTGGGKMSLYAGPCASAIQARKTIVIPDITDSEGWVEYCEIAIPYGFRSVVCAPLCSSEGRMLGMFVLQSREAGEPTPYQKSIVEHFTHMAAMAAERRLIDTALRDSEERFRLLAETTPDVIWITDLHPERVLYCSPSFEKLWGHTVEELYQEPRLWTAVIHPEDVDKVSATFDKGIHTIGGSQYKIEFRLLRKDGSISWINERGVFIANGDAYPHRVSGISTDVTQTKLAEDALLESQERFAIAVAASSDGIWDWDIRRGSMFMSEQAQINFGIPVGPTVRPRDEWQPLMGMSKEDAEQSRLLLEDYLAGRTPTFDGEWRVHLEDGNYRWIRIRGQCLRDAEGKAIRAAGSVSDIDEQKRTEGALQQARRLEAMGTLAGGIAHDFNNILGVILGYGEMALRGAASGSRLRRNLDNIISAGARGRSLVDRILAFSRSGSNERIAVHVEAVVQESIDLVAATLPQNIRIVSQLDGGRAAMQGDPTQIHQVVMNLVTNAMQAMPAGGAIHVRLNTKTITAPLILTTGVLPPGSYLALQVEDTGTGIASDILDRIFDPFFTTKEVGVGTGLGLSLVHGIVLDVGGSIEVSTVMGKGSTFTVYLPHCGDAPGDGCDTTKQLPHGRGERVLLVDDEEPLVRLAEETLSELGYRPVPFTSSLVALEFFRNAPDSFDVVLTDERMPGLTGSAMIAEIRKLRPDIPVLLMSGYLGDLSPRHSHANEILKKPLAIHDLANGLARVLGS